MKTKVYAEVEVQGCDKADATRIVTETLRQISCGTLKAWTDEVRDPRVNPREGDMLEKNGSIRAVTDVSGLSVTYQLKGMSQTCRASTWLNWARNAKVTS